MRVQFNVSNEEWQRIERCADKQGYPDVATFCRAVITKETGDNSYSIKWQQVMSKINDMESGTEFALRDLIDCPPANMGVKLYNHQKKLHIIKTRKDSLKTNQYKKL